jgi:hypothetical protein
MEGYNDADETPNRPQAEAAVGVVAELFERMRASKAELHATAGAVRSSNLV